jgi:hypothetical protein
MCQAGRLIKTATTEDTGDTENQILLYRLSLCVVRVLRGGSALCRHCCWDVVVVFVTLRELVMNFARSFFSALCADGLM